MAELNAQVDSLAATNKKLLQNVDQQQRTIDALQKQIGHLERMREFSCDDWLSFGDTLGENVSAP